MIDTWEKVLDPNFINAELIGTVGTEKVVTIKDIDFREAFDSRTNSKSMKQSLIFEECKPMILNKTNTKTLMKLFSTDNPTPADCVGKKITLYVAAVKVAGKQTTGIRIKEYSEIKCENCGKPIVGYSGKSARELADISKRVLGKELCLDCQRAEKKKMEEKADE